MVRAVDNTGVLVSGGSKVNYEDLLDKVRLAMNSDTITVSNKRLGYEPNMASYQATYQSYVSRYMAQELNWSEDGRINAAYNAVDRYLQTDVKNRVALYWESSDGDECTYTFQDLARLSNRFAHVLQKYRVDRGDRVFLFLPRIPELYISFLGILKQGAVAGTLFAAFGPQALKDRLKNSEAKIVITTVELKSRIQEVRDELPHLERIIIVKPENRRAFLQEQALPASHDDEFYTLLSQHPDRYDIRMLDPEEPAFMLYTSGTTGKPKGVVHVHGGLVHQFMTARYVLDLKPEDIFWCTADPGWVTGIVYGILANWSLGISTVVYEGRFSPEKWYSLIEEYRVTVWYTAPTAIRMLMAAGDELINDYDLSSLRHLVSVGEPLNPEAVHWSLNVFGYPFHDTWWQTETGGILIANYPSMDIKPGSMGKPVPGVNASIVDDHGKSLPVGQTGHLAVQPGWPSMMRSIFKRPEKYRSYFVNDWYISGDLAYRDEDGYFWFVGRDDDVIKTAGERVGPFEVESALVAHPAIAEAGVIGKPDPVRGQIIKAFIALNSGFRVSDELKDDIVAFVKKHLAGHAYPREIEFVDSLPKTRSGKIMRRILKARELGEPIGDTSTLEEY